LLAGQIAIAFLVLAGAALLARNFAALLNQPSGFESAHVLQIPNVPLHGDWDNELVPALRRVPGVHEVAAINSAPMSLGPAEHSRFATRFGIVGRTFDSGSFPVAQNRWATPECFRVLGIPLLSGRWLTASPAGQNRILINQTLARRFFRNQNPVGQHLIFGVMDAKQSSSEIAGVVGDVRDFGLDRDVDPTVYGIFTSPVMTVLIKTTGDPIPLVPAIRSAIQRADPEIPISTIQPLSQNIAAALARRRFVLTLLAIFAAMAALLTAIGVYGLLAYSLHTRLREFGVRGAVGASPTHLLAMILREAAVLMAPGLVGGLILALAFSNIMRGFVYQMSPLDPASLLSAAFFLLLVTLLSAWIPARRAAAVDLCTALRGGS
jgi:predicted permease